MKLTFRLKGGEGSGNFGHSGRPGKVGGSADEGGMGIENAPGIAPKAVAKSTSAREIRDAIYGMDDVRKGVPAILSNPNHNPASYAVERYASQPDVYTFAKGYYYGHGSGESFAGTIQDELSKNGFE